MGNFETDQRALSCFGCVEKPWMLVCFFLFPLTILSPLSLLFQSFHHCLSLSLSISGLVVVPLPCLLTHRPHQADPQSWLSARETSWGGSAITTSCDILIFCWGIHLFWGLQGVIPREQRMSVCLRVYINIITFGIPILLLWRWRPLRWSLSWVVTALWL